MVGGDGTEIMKYLILVLFLTGCCTTEYIDRPVEVKVPVIVPHPEPPVVNEPELPISKLDKESTPNEVAKAYAISIKLLKGYGDQLQTIINSYRNEQQ